MAEQPGQVETGSPGFAEWARAPLARVTRSVLQAGLIVPVLRFLSPVHVIGKSNLQPAPSPAIYIANHQSHLDTPVVLSALGAHIRNRLVVAAAADYFYKSRFLAGAVSLALGTVPFVRQKGGSRQSLDRLKGLIDEGWSVLIFPSGSRDGTPVFKKGFSFLAVDTGTRVVPLCLHGLKDALPKGSFVPLPTGVVVGIGQPIKPANDYDALVQIAQDSWIQLKAQVSRESAGWGETPDESENN